MSILTVGDLARVCAGTISDVDPSMEVMGFATDSRSVSPGEAFVAIRGENFDGHDFADEVIANGASVVVADHAINGIPCVVVPNTLTAYADIAREHLASLRKLGSPVVIGITGSSGKTSTKDLVTDVLSYQAKQSSNIVSPPGSFNNEVGLPATVLRAQSDTQYLILEMGMRGLGHIAELCRIAPPDISVLINIGSAHVGELGSREAIAQAKSEILSNMLPTGTAVLNADDLLVNGLRSLAPGNVITFGEAPTSDVQISDVTLDSEARASFTLSYGGRSVDVTLGLHGEHQVHNAAAAAAVALTCGLDLETVAKALSAALPRSKWRMEVQRTADGITVINDAYNANPESMRAALKSLASMAHGHRTWAVLGEMRELGEHAVEEHDAVGRLAVRLDISHLIAVGEGARPIHMGAAHEGSWGKESQWVPDVAAALAVLDQALAAGDVVLVKASRSIGLERVATTLLAQRGTVEPS